jgi:D-alanyl-D-alanine carboxypeptidase/D-alanyl-D-alanine-endopeptidase (penicillin-binding protein 4)
MRRAAVLKVGALTAALAVSLSTPVARGDGSAPVPGLVERLDAVLASRALRRARVSALVARIQDGTSLYERSPDRGLTPASNMKILTALAALDTFGPSYRFETPVFTDAPPDRSGSVGALYLRGSGDPVLNSEDWWRLAGDLRSAGLRHVRGDLVLDDGAFDGARWHPDWGAVSSRAYHAPVGAVMANYGSFSVTVQPGPSPGDPVRVVVDPPSPYFQVANRGRTGQPRERATLVVDRVAGNGGEVVNVDGRLPAGASTRTYYRSVLDPTRYAGAVFRMQLAALGIQLDGDVRVGPVPPNVHELLRFKGRPMAEIVRLFMKFSNNAVAETLVKAMGVHAGGAGSWESGIRVLRDRLEALGVPLAGLSFVDGSGLSYRDKLSPRALVAALRIAHSSFAVGPEFTVALPIASRDGTLEKRAAASKDAVRAKTGLLNRVTALSGYAQLPDGEVVAFSILANGYRVSDDAAMAALDRFAAALVTK